MCAFAFPNEAAPPFAVFEGWELNSVVLVFPILDPWRDASDTLGIPFVSVTLLAGRCLDTARSCLPLFAGRRGVTPRAMCSPQVLPILTSQLESVVNAGVTVNAGLTVNAGATVEERRLEPRKRYTRSWAKDPEANSIMGTARYLRYNCSAQMFSYNR